MVLYRFYFLTFITVEHPMARHLASALVLQHVHSFYVCATVYANHAAAECRCSGLPHSPM